MSKLREDPIRFVPRRVLLLSLAVTVIAVSVLHFIGWPIPRIIGGYWLGVVASLISFRLIVIGTNDFLDKREAGSAVKGSVMLNFGMRLVVYGVVIFISWRLGTHALIASAIGISMVTIAIKLDGFFTFGYGQNEVRMSSQKTDYESDEAKGVARDEASKSSEASSEVSNEEGYNNIDLHSMKK